MKPVYIVLPKISAYQFKDSDVQLQIERTVKKYVKLCGEIGLGIKCFAEDTLAQELLSGTEGIRWLSLLSENDANYFSNELHEKFRDNYARHLGQKVPEYYLTTAKDKYPLTKQNEQKRVDRNSPEYIMRRLSIMHNRLRCAANDILEDSKLNIVFTSKGNDYCKLLSPYIGDGKLLITVDLDYAIETYVYSGMPLQENEAEAVLRSLII